MSKTTEQRIEEIVKDVVGAGSLGHLQLEIVRLELEALVLSAKLDQLKESK